MSVQADDESITYLCPSSAKNKIKKRILIDYDAELKDEFDEDQMYEVAGYKRKNETEMVQLGLFSMGDEIECY